MKKVELYNSVFSKSKNKERTRPGLEHILYMLGRSKTYYLCFIATNLLLIFHHPLFLGITAALAMLLGFYYYKYLKIAKSITIKRKVLEKYIQHEQLLTVDYIATNHSPFYCPPITISDTFTGTLKKKINIQAKDIIGAKAKKKFFSTVACDGNTGEAEFHELSVFIADPLNFFQFKASFDIKDSILIFPVIKSMQKFAVKPYDDSIDFGLYNISKTGNAVNFIGVRKYQDGDPVKRINWKISQKAGELIVNEYERNVNAQVSIFMDMHSHIHAGQGKNSTWEYMKDIALSIATRNLKMFNKVQLLTNDQVFSAGSGSNDTTYMQLAISNSTIKPDMNYKMIFDRIYHHIPHGTNYFHIAPFINVSLFYNLVDNLYRIKSKANSFSIIIVNPQIYIAEILSQFSKSLAEYAENNIREFKEVIVPQLAKLDIELYFIDIDEKERKTYQFHDIRREYYGKAETL